MLIGVRIESVVPGVLGQYICPLTALGVYRSHCGPFGPLWAYPGQLNVGKLLVRFMDLLYCNDVLSVELHSK